MGKDSGQIASCYTGRLRFDFPNQIDRNALPSLLNKEEEVACFIHLLFQILCLGAEILDIQKFWSNKMTKIFSSITYKTSKKSILHSSMCGSYSSHFSTHACLAYEIQFGSA